MLEAINFTFYRIFHADRLLINDTVGFRVYAITRKLSHLFYIAAQIYY